MRVKRLHPAMPPGKAHRHHVVAIEVRGRAESALTLQMRFVRGYTQLDVDLHRLHVAFDVAVEAVVLRVDDVNFDATVEVVVLARGPGLTIDQPVIVGHFVAVIFFEGFDREGAEHSAAASFYVGRMVGRKLVQTPARQGGAESTQDGIGRAGVYPNPVACWNLPGPRLDGPLDECNKIFRVVLHPDADLEHFRNALDHPVEVEGVFIKVVVGIDQPGNDGVPFCIDHLCPVGGQCPDLGIAAYGENLIATNCNRFGNRDLVGIVIIRCDDLAINDDCLGKRRCAREGIIAKNQRGQ